MNYDDATKALQAQHATAKAKLAAAAAARNAKVAELRTLAEQSRAILNGAEQEHRARSPEEDQQLADLDRRMTAMESEASQLVADAAAAEAEWLGLPTSIAIRPGVNDNGRGTDMGTETRAGTGSRWLDIKTGQEIRALRPDERLSDALEFTEEERSLRLDRYLVGRLTGKWRGAEPEKRAAMIVGDAASAGYLVPAPLAAQLIDLARKQSVVMRAGAQTIPMSSGQLSLAKVVGDPTAYWYADEVRTAGLTESSSTFGRLNLYSRTLAILERASVELAEDAPNFGTVLSEQIAKALALELDRGVLFGIAQQGWDGLRQWSDLNEISMGTNGAHLTTYAQFVQAVQKVLEGNYPGAVDQLTAVMAPRTWSTIEQLTEATTNSPLRGPDSYNRLQKMVSTQLPITEVQGSAVDASTIFVGDFSQVAIGVRTDVNLEFTREGGDAFTRLHTLFRGYLRADWTVLQSKFLTRIVGVTVA